MMNRTFNGGWAGAAATVGVTEKPPAASENRSTKYDFIVRNLLFGPLAHS
jgi:hypothetical protein